MWFKRREHKHYGHGWDGYYEYCRCGLSAGDRRNSTTGERYIFFSEWEDK